MTFWVIELTTYGSNTCKKMCSLQPISIINLLETLGKHTFNLFATMHACILNCVLVSVEKRGFTLRREINKRPKKKKNGLVLTRNEIPSEGWLSGVLIIINYLRHTLSGSLLLILAQAWLLSLLDSKFSGRKFSRETSTTSTHKSPHLFSIWFILYSFFLRIT